VADSETEFTGPISQSQYSFLVGEQGRVTGVRVRSRGLDFIAPRIDAATCEEIHARLAARIQSKAPAPGSEAALRRLIDGLISGTPNYDEMSAPLAHVLREQLPQLHVIARYLGAVQSVTFKYVGKDGSDVYEVHRENGVAQWRIALADGVITGASGAIIEGL
jgi:hypothetical protein